MNFSAMPEERIREGVERMGRVLHATVGRCEPAVAGV
jgi:DNA-binding transcriptional MocR family regulator